MARIHTVAAVQMDFRRLRGAPGMEAAVLDEINCLPQHFAGASPECVLLPESVAAEGMAPDRAESVQAPGPFLSASMNLARTLRSHVGASLMLREGDAIWNALVLLTPAGEVCGIYRKTYLTGPAIEAGVRSGPGAEVMETPVGRLGGLICFDLNFETLREDYRALHPEMLLFSSVYHGGFVQQTWAYECGAFLLAATGHGPARILDPLGGVVAESHNYCPVAMADINLDFAIVHLDHNRDRFAEIRRRHQGEVEIVIPPYLGSAIIYSLGASVTALDIVKEYNLELRDTYFQQAAVRNEENRSR